ncbi:Abi family protein [Corynebacterium uropygiale]|uniref:Abi family protein n=1 Tax=Corynebacterium uropygiale TaxID=1775911 RepID=A0A9X1U0W4_9CORY|nr:Abi family protein [Corynebacterium uropygiale]MCF4007219.1 Abi family protein [Corynebacterium uropygiale]
MVKPFSTYEEQINILRSRGMEFHDPELALKMLHTHNYYRLSGYWHSMRELDTKTHAPLDKFREGTSFELVADLYHFDSLIRSSIISCLSPIEIAFRSLLSYHLGKIDPLIHLNEQKLSIAPDKQAKKRIRTYQEWRNKYHSSLAVSREDFIVHYRRKYNSILPIWVAVEIMDWGMLSRLYQFSPRQPREEIAQICSMTAPQLESWLRSLNVLRNHAAHQARIFTRVFSMKPKPINDHRMREANRQLHKLFGQLCLIRYLQLQLGLQEGLALIPEALRTYPTNSLIPLERTGTPHNWRELELWSPKISRHNAHHGHATAPPQELPATGSHR